jgi:hypothetical protein
LKRGAFLLAILKDSRRNYLVVKPWAVKKIFFNDNSELDDFDIFEKYTFEVEAKTGSFKWMFNEFSHEKMDDFENLKVDIEYIPLVLTLFRINKFLNSNYKNMASVLSSDLDNMTNEIITKESLLFANEESSNIVFVYLKKRKTTIEHHLIFSSMDYNNYFDIKINVKPDILLNFYSNLLNEFNKYRLETLPVVIQSMSNVYDEVIKGIDVLNYDNIKDIEDKIFSIYDIDIMKIIDPIDSSTDFEDYINYLNFLYKENNNNKDENEVEIDFMIEDMENLEEQIKNILENEDFSEEDGVYSVNISGNDVQNSENEELFNEIEEEMMEILDGIIFEDDYDEDYIIDELKTLIKNVNFLFSNNIYTKADFQRKLLLDIINAYGVKKVLNITDLLQEVFEDISIEMEIDSVYAISEDKIINDYKKWYKNIFSSKGISIFNAIKNGK